jgi:translation initiation factor 1
MCPACSKPISSCVCRQKKANAKVDGIVKVWRETKGRKGKGVTLISGMPLDATELKDFARQLKSMCGAGGTVHDGAIEIQGDHREVLLQELKKRGWTAKLVGG